MNKEIKALTDQQLKNYLSKNQRQLGTTETMEMVAQEIVKRTIFKNKES